MKVLIVGAGEQGYVLTWDLAGWSATDDIILVDFDESKALEVAERVGQGKVRVVTADARDVEGIASLASGCDLLLNAVLPESSEALMRAALRARTNYLDMAVRADGGTVDEGFLAQISLNDEFKNAERTALIHTGMTPGVTNTLAAIGYEDMDSCEAVRIRFAGVFESQIPIQPWSQETYYIDSQTPSLYFSDGEFLRAAPFGGWEYYDFPAPVGTKPVVFHEHEECSSLPRCLPRLGEKNLRYVDCKLGASEDSLRRTQILCASGFASPEPVNVRGTMVRPIDVLVALLPPKSSMDDVARAASAGQIVDEGVYVVELFRQLGEPSAERFYISSPNIQWVTERIPGACRVSYGTSIAAATYARFLLAGRINLPGVTPPELLPRATRLAYVEELMQRGYRILRQSTRPF